MTTINTGRWLLLVAALVGLALVAPAVSAHGDETATDDAPPYNGTAEEWAAWMVGHMTDHMGAGGVEWMESHEGVTGDEGTHDRPHDGYAGRGYGQGHC